MKLQCLCIVFQLYSIMHIVSLPIEYAQRARSQKSLCDFNLCDLCAFSLSVDSLNIETHNLYSSVYKLFKLLA